MANRTAVWLTAAVVLASCGGRTEQGFQAPTHEVSSTPTPAATAVTTRPATTESLVRSYNAAEIDSCVEQTMVLAFVGDEFWAAHWTNLGQNEDRLKTWCIEYGDTNPSGLRELHENWARFFSNAASASTIATTTSTTTTTSPRVSAADVTTCVDWVEWHRDTGEAVAINVWQAVDRSASALASFCRDLALEQPVAIAEMGTDMRAIRQFLDRASQPPEPRPFIPAPNPDCHPNYGGCVPIASDVDCAGGSGNGPAYVRGPVQIIGADVYDLDRDGDGVACE